MGDEETKKRIYVVTEEVKGHPKTETLVRAQSQSAALNAVIEPRFAVAKASTDDVVRLMGAGAKVQEVADD